MSEAKQLTPRQQARQRRIFETTRDLLAESGYEGLQMRVLADRAGVSPMTLYNRYGTKDDLVLLSMEELLADLADEAQASRKRGLEFVRHNAAIVARQILETPRYAKAMALSLFNSRPGSPISRALLTNNIAASRQLIGQMQELGELDADIDTEQLSRGMAIAPWSTIMLWMQEQIDDDAFTDEYIMATVRVLFPAMTTATRKRYADRLR